MSMPIWSPEICIRMTNFSTLSRQKQHGFEKFQWKLCWPCFSELIKFYKSDLRMYLSFSNYNTFFLGEKFIFFSFKIDIFEKYLNFHRFVDVLHISEQRAIKNSIICVPLWSFTFTQTIILVSSQSLSVKTRQIQIDHTLNQANNNGKSRTKHSAFEIIKNGGLQNDSKEFRIDWHLSKTTGDAASEYI